MRPIDSVQFDAVVPISPSSERKSGEVEKPPQSADGRAVRPELGTAYQPFFQKALANPLDEGKDSPAVLEAKRALEQGQLDSPQAARQAAEAILRFGI